MKLLNAFLKMEFILIKPSEGFKKLSTDEKSSKILQNQLNFNLFILLLKFHLFCSVFIKDS